MLIDHLVLEVRHEQYIEPLKAEAISGWVWTNLRQWQPIRGFINGNIDLPLPSDEPIRYIRIDGSPELVWHVRGYYLARALDRTNWRASNLFATYRSAPAEHAWSVRFTLDRIASGAYLALAIHGEHGKELAYAGVRTPTGYLGAPRRSPSFRSNSWECPVRHTRQYHLLLPLGPELVGQNLEAFALLLKGGNSNVQPVLWLTTYPIPWVSRRLVLVR